MEWLYGGKKIQLVQNKNIPGRSSSWNVLDILNDIKTSTQPT